MWTSGNFYWTKNIQIRLKVKLRMLQSLTMMVIPIAFKSFKFSVFCCMLLMI